MLWKLNRIQYPVYNLGKGSRIGIWVQGCSLACKGCISKTLQTKTGGKNIKIEHLIKEIVKVNQDFSGITITGGEPFQQSKQLIAFSASVKKMTNLEIYVFSGYSLNELVQLFPDKLFLKYIDFLLDGRYEHDKHDNNNVKGSTNQRLYKFENNKAVLKDKYFESNKVSIKVDNDMQVYLSGIPKKNELNKLSEHIKESGINLKFK